MEHNPAFDDMTAEELKAQLAEATGLPVRLTSDPLPDYNEGELIEIRSYAVPRYFIREDGSKVIWLAKRALIGLPQDWVQIPDNHRDHAGIGPLVVRTDDEPIPVGLADATEVTVEEFQAAEGHADTLRTSLVA